MVSINPLDIGTTCRSKDQGADVVSFGHHLLELGSRHRMVIYNGLDKWPGSIELTCFPHEGGESTVDYLIGRPEAIHMINSFRVAPCPIGADHTFLYFEPKSDISNVTRSSPPSHHTTIHFTHELFDIYSQHFQAHLSLHLESLTTELTHILHSATISNFPYTKHSSQGRVGSMPQNRWYDEDCRDLHRQLKVLQLSGTITSVSS